MTLTVTASNETVSVVDSILSKTDTVGYVNTNNPVISTKKKSWFKRAYEFCDRVLSPPRDSNYIDVQSYYNWCGELQFTTRFEIYEMSSDADNFSIRVSPEPRHRIGPFFGWRFAFLGYNFDIKSIFMNGDDTDIGGSIYSAAFGLDLFYRRVGGNYKVKTLNIHGIDYTKILQGEPFDGINVGMSRLSFYYVFNYNHYSHQAAFSQTHRQIRSAGSPILGLSYAHNKVTMDWEKMATMVNSTNLSNVNSTPLYENQKCDEYSASVGYGYNWVFAKNWLAAGELAGSIGYLSHHTNIKSRQEESIESKKNGQSSENIFNKIDYFRKKNIALDANLRVAVLYNNGPWFAGSQFVMFYYNYGNGNVMNKNALGSAYVFVGFNF